MFWRFKLCKILVNNIFLNIELSIIQIIHLLELIVYSVILDILKMVRFVNVIINYIYNSM